MGEGKGKGKGEGDREGEEKMVKNFTRCTFIKTSLGEGKGKREGARGGRSMIFALLLPLFLIFFGG